MEAIFLVILILLLGVVSAILYLNLRSKPEDQKENKEAEEIAQEILSNKEEKPKPKAKRKTKKKEPVAENA